MKYQSIHSVLLRKTRRLAEKHGHRLCRFRLVKGSEESRLGREWWSECKFCGTVVLMFPEFKNRALISMHQCGNRDRRATFIISSEAQ